MYLRSVTDVDWVYSCVELVSGAGGWKWFGGGVSDWSVRNYEKLIDLKTQLPISLTHGSDPMLVGCRIFGVRNVKREFNFNFLNFRKVKRRRSERLHRVKTDEPQYDFFILEGPRDARTHSFVRWRRKTQDLGWNPNHDKLPNRPTCRVKIERNPPKFGRKGWKMRHNDGK
jgi:hypothetical protein